MIARSAELLRSSSKPAATGLAPIVRLEGVCKSFHSADATTEVLTNVSLTILPGEKASLVGPSGSGKSTLLALIAGLLRPDAGVVAIDGVPIGGLDDTHRAAMRARRIGIALQSDNLIPFLTAQENIELALAFGRRRTRSEARHRALELLSLLGVVHRAHHHPRHLSGGEAQRVALAVSMANEPDLLLADEVVAQLDGDTAARVVDEVLTAPFAVLYVTHDLGLADLAPTRYALAGVAVVAR